MNLIKKKKEKRKEFNQLLYYSEKSPMKKQYHRLLHNCANTGGKHWSYNLWLTNLTVSCHLRTIKINSQIF